MGIAEPPRRVRSSFATILFAAMLAGAAGCGSGDLPLDQVDPGAAPAVPTYDQVYAILQRACVPCHGGGSSAPATQSAFSPQEDGGEDLNLENCVDIVAQRDGILERIENNTMPTGALPRLTSVEKLLIRRWVEQGAVAPCN
jgi:uncharacterized membrane protein